MELAGNHSEAEAGVGPPTAQHKAKAAAAEAEAGALAHIRRNTDRVDGSGPLGLPVKQDEICLFEQVRAVLYYA